MNCVYALYLFFVYYTQTGRTYTNEAIRNVLENIIVLYINSYRLRYKDTRTYTYHSCL